MTGRVFSELLDLSRLPPPDLVRPVDHALIKAERLDQLQQEFLAKGIAYDVGGTEADPFVILEEVDAYREYLDLIAINDAGRARMLAFARGADLDQLAALFDVERLADEADDRLRRRVMLAPDAYGTAGSEGAYVFWALTADIRVEDAAAFGPGTLNLKPGQVTVAISAAPEVAGEVLDVVRRKLFSPSVKPLTDMLSVYLAKTRRFRIGGIIELRRGPDPLVVLAEARARLDAYLADRRRIGAIIARSGIDAALHVRAADRVIVSQPSGDIEPGLDGIALCEEIQLQTRIGAAA